MTGRLSAAAGQRRAPARHQAGARRAAGRWLAAGLAAAAWIALLAALAGPAQASVGVGVQGAPVRLRGIAYPGGSYPLPAVYVVNTGTVDESITLHVQRLSRGPGRAVPPSWVHFTGAGIRLEGIRHHGTRLAGIRLAAHTATRVPLELDVPAGAEPGQYLSDVVVVGSATVAAGPASLGAAAATKLEFRVGQGSASGLGIPAWTLWAAAGLVLLGAAILAFRWSGLQIMVMRRPARAVAAGRRGGNDVS